MVCARTISNSNVSVLSLRELRKVYTLTKYLLIKLM